MRSLALTCAACAALAAAPPAPADAQWGTLLKRAEQAESLHVSEAEEIQLGEAVSEKIRVRYGVVQDPAVHRYVTLVGTLLTQAGSRPNLPWHFIVLDTDGVNAFAAPGGFIHITRGALALIQNEAELAAVLAHEATHVTGKHTVKAIQKSKAVQIGASETLQNKEVFSRVVDATTEVVLAGFGRSEELESDREALRLVNEVGYSPAALGAFLTRLTERNRASTGKQGLFASHPEMKERLERLQQQIAQERLASTVLLDTRYRRFVSYESKPLADVPAAVEGAAGLASGGEEATPPPPPPPKKKGLGLGNLLKPGGGSEKKSAEVTGSGASRGVDTERGAKGGGDPTMITVSISKAEVDAFRAEGKLR
jgi:predicted Zn-dependent protease